MTHGLQGNQILTLLYVSSFQMQRYIFFFTIPNFQRTFFNFGCRVGNAPTLTSATNLRIASLPTTPYLKNRNPFFSGITGFEPVNTSLLAMRLNHLTKPHKVFCCWIPCVEGV